MDGVTEAAATQIRKQIEEIREMIFPICYHTGNYSITDKIDALLKQFPKPKCKHGHWPESCLRCLWGEE